MVFSREEDALDRIRRQADNSEIDMLAKRELIWQKIQTHPWELLSAIDTDGMALVRTKDEKDDTGMPFKPYPYEREYLRHLVYTMMDPSITILVVEKNRQIMASYTALLVAWWKILNLEAQNIFVSRNKKDTSIKLIEDKIRDTHKRLPKWVKERWQITAEPKDIIRAENTGSQILAVPMSFADSESRGDSASEIIVDEAAYQSALPKIITSALSMAKRITMISTPSGDSVGGKIMQVYMKRAKEHAYRVDTPVDGLTITRAKVEGSTAELALFSVRHKTEEQANKGWLYINDSSRRQEEELSWEHTDGNAYFPEAELYGGEKLYAKECTELDINLPIERGFDFGVMRPACVWAQVDPVNVKIHIVGAILGKDIDPWSFAALVRYISGEIGEKELAGHVPAIQLLNELVNEGYPPFPWFQRGFQFRNWAGHEANRPLPTGPAQKIMTSAQIFAAEGIPLNPLWVPKERREFILRHLLKPREDGVPSILVDKLRAPIVLRGILGGLVRPLSGRGKEITTEEPIDDHYFKDVYDAYGYILNGCFSHVNWNGVTTTSKGAVRDSIEFNRLSNLSAKRWGDTSSKRTPLVRPVRW